jgi:EmrB/QacA subfamily drug resistance transporter
MTDNSVVLAEEEGQSTGAAKHLGWALVLICVAQLMVVLDATIANIAIPFIGKDLSITGTNLTWIVTGYALAFGGFLLLGGRLGDLYGRRRAFMIGLSVFAVASLLGGLATNESLLLGARGLQGLGAALASPAALSLITTTFPPGPSRNRAMAMYATMSGVGAAIGLILGGWLTGSNPSIFGWDVHGWRLTFLINVPIGLAAAFLAPRILPESDRHNGHLDVPGAFLGTAGLVSLVFGLTRAGNQDYGWGAASTIGALVAAAVMLVAFVVVESRVAEPLLPFRVFANRTRAASFVAMMLMPAAMFSMFFFLSQYMQNVIGYSPLRTGFAFLPFCFGMVISAGIVSNLVTKFDPRFIAGIGTLIAASALFGFSRLSVDDDAQSVLAALQPGHHLGAGINYWTQIMPFITIMALGMGAVFVPLTLTAVHHLRHEDSGIGSGVLNTMQQIGGALGLAVLSTVGAHFGNAHAEKIGGALHEGFFGWWQSLPGAEQAGMLAKAGVKTVDQLFGGVTYLGSFPTGATHGFLVGTFLMLGASLIVWLFLDVKHEELQDAAGHGGVHIG